MRILANETFPGDAVAALRLHGHDVARVRADDRILVTFDKDFGELAFRAGLPVSSGIILFRISTPSSAHVARVAVEALGSRTDWEGHFAVVEDGRIRMTPLPAASGPSP
jgi:hypothetical protein